MVRRTKLGSVRSPDGSLKKPVGAAGFSKWRRELVEIVCLSATDRSNRAFCSANFAGFFPISNAAFR